jgi:photosystem II stability/assembly factor-like uncharacterized protein
MSRLAARAVLAVAVLLLARHGGPIAAQTGAKAAADRGRPAAPYGHVLKALTARCIGPANMGGRIADLAVVESDPKTFYVATAGGGVWKTTDGGLTLTPVFDGQHTQSIGSVAVCQGKPEVVYVGTGEGNPRNSVSWGHGVYRSADGGKTWDHCGLAETHHIGRVVAHPTNPEVAYVAALGKFWSANKERGLYKTADGGKTWELSKFIDEDTGFVDVQMDPSDPDTLYAAAWAVRRDGFSGGSPKAQTGASAGLFKTTDGGRTWEKMGGGLPEGVEYGRCGLSVYRKDPNVVYAIVQTDKTAGSLTNTGQMPAELGKGGGKAAPPGAVERGGVFRSDDKGKTWKKVSDLVPRPFYYGQVRVDPTDAARVYVLGVNFYTSTDGGKTFAAGGMRGAHADHHALWIDPKNPDHLIDGNDGGLSVSHDRGKTAEAMRGFAIGQFYGVAVDTRTPYRVYGGLQDNGSWGGPTATPYPDGVTLADWRRVGGGDGFQAAVDPTDPDTVYVESQYGNLTRVNVKALDGGGGKGKGGGFGGGKKIAPPAAKEGGKNRFNWNAPILLSPHDSKTLYYGSQFLHKTTNRGDSWERISPDLTRGPRGEAVTNSGHNILAIAESPAKAGVLWVGTDDGNVWASRDGGKEWADVSEKVPGVPRARAIPKIECSSTDAGTAYLAIDRHRNGDYHPYIFRTTDYGETWTKLTDGLPDRAVVGVVRESSRAPNLLFAGTEIGLYASLDAGKSWHHLDRTGMPPAVRVDDLVIHPRERELVIGTHGRSVWVMDIAPLEQLSSEVLRASAHLFDFKPVTVVPKKARPEGKGGAFGGVVRGAFVAANPRPGAVAYFHLARPAAEVTIAVSDASGKELFEVRGGAYPAGLHARPLDLTEPGEYTVTLKAGGVTRTKAVTVKGEPAAKGDEEEEEELAPPPRVVGR